jgi:hypothetical protein
MKRGKEKKLSRSDIKMGKTPAQYCSEVKCDSSRVGARDWFYVPPYLGNDIAVSEGQQELLPSGHARLFTPRYYLIPMAGA